MLFLCKASTVLEKQTQNEMLFIKIHPENMKDVLEYVRKDVLEYSQKRRVRICQKRRVRIC
jgi:hypothetical protein